MFIGPLASCLFVSMMGIAPSALVMLMLLLLVGASGSSFHPQGAVLAGNYAGKSRGFALSVFGIGGVLGYGVGPLASAFFVAEYGLDKFVYSAAPGLLILLLYTFIGPGFPLLQSNEKRESLKNIFRHHTKGLGLLVLAACFNGLVVVSFNSFIPFLIQQRGLPLTAAGTAIFILQIFGAVGSMTGGRLSDSHGRKIIMLSAMFLGPLFFLLSLYLPGLWMYVMLALGGLILFAASPTILAYAQEKLPGNQGFAASLIIGVSWGLAGVALSLIGWAADNYGIRPVLTAVTFFPPLVAAVLIKIKN